MAVKQLWAPWRMAYIESDSTAEEGCIFCVKPAADRDEENLIIYRGPRVFVIMNKFPYNNGHLMIAPYQHVPSIEELDAETLTELMTTTQRMLAAMRAAFNPHGFNMGINQGAVAGAGIADHVHLHIVPRWNGDTNFMPVLADTKVMPDFIQNTARQIREQLTPPARSGDAEHTAMSGRARTVRRSERGGARGRDR